jgi:hypothetical protein
LASSQEKPFTRYRQVVYVAYFAFVGLVGLYLIASVSVWLLQRDRARQMRPPIGDQPRIEELLACHTEVDRLFHDLNHRYDEIPSQLADAPFDVGQRARELQTQWRRRWREVGQHCRFNELSGKLMQPGFDRLTTVHADLEELDIGYAALLGRFGRQLASGVDDMRKTLQASRQSLEAAARRGAPDAAARAGRAATAATTRQPAPAPASQPTRAAGAPPAPAN